MLAQKAFKTYRTSTTQLAKFPSKTFRTTPLIYKPPSTIGGADTNATKTTKTPASAVPKSTFASYYELGRFDKPIGTYLFVWPALWSVGMGTAVGSFPDPIISSIFIAGAFAFRSGGCAANDLWDRDFDNKVERTKTRPIASGALTPAQGTKFMIANFAVGLGLMSFLPSTCYWITCALLPIGALYPAAKRFTNYPQFVLGSCFGWGSLVGYAAATGGINSLPVTVPLFLGCWSWIVFYDTIYGHQDKSFDKKIGIKSTALTWGENTPKILNHLANVTTALWAYSGYACGLNWAYFAGLAACRAHMEWQRTTVNYDDPDDCGNKFRSNNHLAAILFAAIVLGKQDWLSIRKEEKKEDKK